MLAEDVKNSLIQAALAVQARAYCPYSKYPVGAALLARNGQVFCGCNVENASFPITNCAEKTAICSAVAAGVREFDAICVVTRDSGLPCGACRQTLNEFADENFLVICCNGQGVVTLEKRLSEILPHAFGPKNLQ